MVLLPHQKQKSTEALKMLKEKNICYIFGEPRSGKTLTALETIVNFSNKDNFKCLILTKKNAINGWLESINSNDKYKNRFIVTNYEQVLNISKQYTFDYYIQDESHNLASVGRAKIRYKSIKSIVYNLPTIFLSGTPIVETALSIYYQTTVTKFSPFSRFKNFYKFFYEYGIPNKRWCTYGIIETYTMFKPKLLDDINDFVINIKLQDAGFNYHNTDKLHFVPMPKSFFKMVEKVTKDRIYNDKPFETIPSLIQFLHLSESGLYYDNEDFQTFKEEFHKYKINYLLNTFQGSIALMCHFKAEQTMLKQCLPSRVKIFSSTADAEGVDLSNFDNLVIYSQGYSGSKFIQRRNRIVNINNNNHSEVHFLLVKNGISEKVYNSVSNKKTFNDKVLK